MDMQKKIFSADIEGSLIVSAVLGFGLLLACTDQLWGRESVVPAPWLWLGFLLGVFNIGFVVHSVFLDREQQKVKDEHATT